MQPEANIPDLLGEGTVHLELSIYVYVCVCWRGQPRVPDAGQSCISAKVSTEMPQVWGRGVR